MSCEPRLWERGRYSEVAVWPCVPDAASHTGEAAPSRLPTPACPWQNCEKLREPPTIHQTVLRACRDCSFPGGGGYAAEGSLGFFAPPRPSLPAAPGSLSSHSACTVGVPQLESPRSTFGSIATQSTPRFRSVNETPIATARDRAFWRFSRWNLRFAVCLAWHAPIKNCVSTETAEGRAQSPVSCRDTLSG